MKDRRGFLKLLGIGAGAVAAGVLAIVAGTPAPAPRTIQDIEKPTPYIGPDGVPGGDYIKERPKVVPDFIKPPELTPDQYKWIVNGEKIMTFDLTPPPQLMNFEVNYDMDYQLEPGAPIPTVDPGIQLTTTGTYYDHNLGGYPVTTADAHSFDNQWAADAISDEFGL